MKPLTTRQLIKQLECCSSDSIPVMMTADGSLQHIYSVDEDMAVCWNTIHLLSDYIDLAHMESELLEGGNEYLDFVNVSILK